VGSGARAAAACGDDVGRDERTCKRAVGAIAPSWSRQPTSDTALLRADLDRLRCSAVALGAVAAVAISPAKLETGLGLAGLHGGHGRRSARREQDRGRAAAALPVEC
jgi:hypothetical protein